MSISGALSNAVLGLRAASRGAEIVSTNISNALTPGYGRRELTLSSSSVTGGVKIGSVLRVVDAGIAADRRLADAEHTKATLTSDFFARVETLLGTPNDGASLSGRMSSFENSLIAAASRPDANERLSNVVSEARGLANSIKVASKGVQEARTRADSAISTQVDELNAALQQVQRLNSMITSTQVQSGDASTLMDQRQQVIDQISVLVPVREITRSNGQIALYTQAGTALIDGQAATVEFDKVNLVTPYMSLSGGELSGLTINGNAVRTDSEKGALRGGSIGAQFAIRDESAPDAQTKLDAVARDLVERFQDPAVDTTLAPGDAGLFTDDGAAFDPLDEVGLSERLVINAAVDPNQGGEAWRIRDGINTATPGNVGDATLIHSLGDALSNTRVPASGGFGSGAFSASNLISTFVSDIYGQRNNSDQTLTFAASRLTELTERQLADGVDTDAELQRLLVLEQAYAANARMIEAVDEMMQTIIRL